MRLVRNVTPALAWAYVIFAQALVFAQYVMVLTMMPRVLTVITPANARIVEVRAHALYVKEKDITDYGKSTVVYRYYRTAAHRWHGSVAFWRKETS